MVSPTPQLLCCPLLVGRPQGGESDLPPHCDSVRVTEGCAAPCRSNRVWALGAQQGVPKVAAPVGAGTLAALLQQHAGRLLSPGGLSTFGPCPDQAQYSSATGASVVITGAVRSMQGETVPSREGRTVGRRAPAWPQSVVSRGAGRPARSSAAALSLPQGVGREQALCSSAIPGARVPPTAGAPQLPAGLSDSAPSARGPGAEPARGPGQHTHQPRPRASAQQAASSSSACEATPVSRRGSLLRAVVLGSWADGAYHKEAYF
ncbi:hypothetical protein NDU88_005839 [Pleurodeles waltl]|uniref:Uncharacterized protein n=1 Tax=Pleurodeles waltl TaxID=8319 RepID=A0AAV7SN09_PLEWA|nr:hypothetical protein NDU88_005839 [Pleurodeles waltl]